MRFTIALVLCACACWSAADVRAVKARLAGKLHKRGVLSAVPPFKLGHDIPRVTHSVVKPLVVTYPPAATVAAVKVPLSHPLLPRYPVGVGHRVPHLPHPHYGLKFPHHTKSVVLPKPDHHYHHHHHHVSPRPVVPVVPAAPLPVATPAIAQPVPVPSPSVIVPQPSPLPPPVRVLPPPHLHLRPLVPAPVVPAAPAPIVAPAVSSFAPQFPYILQAGGALQSSLFATYPRYPYSNYPSPLIPLGASAFSQIVPHQYLVPQGGAPDGVVVEQPVVHGEQTTAVVHAHGEIPDGAHPEPAQPGFHLHSAQPEVHLQTPHGVQLHPEQPNFHLQPEVHLHSAQPEVHLQTGVHAHGQPDINLQSAQPDYHLQPQPDYHIQPQPDYHLQPQPDYHLQPQPDYHLQPGHTDIHSHPAEPEFHFQGGHTDVHVQPQPDYHFQPGHTDVHLQPQPDYHLQPQPNYSDQAGGLQPTLPIANNEGWSPVPSHSAEAGHSDGLYPGDSHHQFTQEQGNPVFEQHLGSDQQFHDYQNQLHHHIQQQLDQAQYEHQLHTQQPAAGQATTGDYSYPQPAPEYGPPGAAEGRSGDAEGEGDSQLYHNHIPLGLQPPIDRPLDHFQR